VSDEKYKSMLGQVGLCATLLPALQTPVAAGRAMASAGKDCHDLQLTTAEGVGLLTMQTIFNEVTALPSSKKGYINYALTTVDLCNTPPDQLFDQGVRYGRAFAKCFDYFVDNSSVLCGVVRERLIEFFVHHLNNTQWMWKWASWEKKIGESAGLQLFVNRLLARAQQLEQRDRILSLRSSSVQSSRIPSTILDHIPPPSCVDDSLRNCAEGARDAVQSKFVSVINRLVEVLKAQSEREKVRDVINSVREDVNIAVGLIESIRAEKAMEEEEREQRERDVGREGEELNGEDGKDGSKSEGVKKKKEKAWYEGPFLRGYLPPTPEEALAWVVSYSFFLSRATSFDHTTAGIITYKEEFRQLCEEGEHVEKAFVRGALSAWWPSKSLAEAVIEKLELEGIVSTSAVLATFFSTPENGPWWYRWNVAQNALDRALAVVMKVKSDLDATLAKLDLAENERAQNERMEMEGRNDGDDVSKLHRRSEKIRSVLVERERQVYSLLVATVELVMVVARKATADGREEMGRRVQLRLFDILRTYSVHIPTLALPYLLSLAQQCEAEAETIEGEKAAKAVSAFVIRLRALAVMLGMQLQMEGEEEGEAI